MESVFAALFGVQFVQLGLTGGVGGVARWLYAIALDRRMQPRQGLATVGLGGIVGAFGDATKGWVHNILSGVGLDVDPDKLPFLSAFLLGAAGVAILGLGFDYLKAKDKELNKGEGVAMAPPKPEGDAK